MKSCKSLAVLLFLFTAAAVFVRPAIAESNSGEGQKYYCGGRLVALGSVVGFVQNRKAGGNYARVEAVARLVNASTLVTLGLVEIDQTGVTLVALNSNSSAPNFTWFHIPPKSMTSIAPPTAATSHEPSWSIFQYQSALKIPTWLQLRHC